MIFLSPGFFLVSLAVAAAVVALHFIVTRQPRAGVLPTARFVPNLPATATARATRPSDPLLMLLRVLLILAVGAGLARPMLKPSRTASARVILVDASRSVGNVAAVRDSARGYYREGDALVVFDSAARSINAKPADSLSALAPSRHAGRISSALIAGMRAASNLRDKADAFELVIVSPFAADEVDAATDSIRTLWPGSARLIQAGSSPSAQITSEPVQIRPAAGDPLAVAIARIGNAGGPAARIVRDGPNAEDLSWVAGGNRVLVDWPAASRPKGATPRSRVDTIGGVVSGESLVVAGFGRKWRYTPDSIGGGEVVARWVNGEPAAIEWTNGSGCVRSVAVPVNPVGDLPLRSSFIRFAAAMTRDCVSRGAVDRISQQQLSLLAGSRGLAQRDAFRPRDDVRSTLAPWLLGLALVVAIAELFVRRKRDQYAVSQIRQAARTGKAA